MSHLNARVRIEVEIPVGNWNSRASFNELKEQVRREGLSIVQDVAAKNGWKISGDPQVVMFYAMEQK